MGCNNLELFAESEKFSKAKSLDFEILPVVIDCNEQPISAESDYNSGMETKRKRVELVLTMFAGKALEYIRPEELHWVTINSFIQRLF